MMLQPLESRLLFATTVPITSLFNTGVATNNASGTPATLVAPGKSDPHYSIIGQPNSTQTVAAQVTLENGQPLPGSWADNDSSSRWVSPHADESLAGREPAGTFKYITKFSLAGLLA